MADWTCGHRTAGRPTRHADRCTTCRALAGEKVCQACGVMRPLTGFHKGTGANGLQYACKSCQVARVYGIDADEYAALLADPCAICGGESEVLDHDHGTGANRRALCQDCNIGLGRFHDSPERLRLAADYVEAHSRAKELI